MSSSRPSILLVLESLLKSTSVLSYVWQICLLPVEEELDQDHDDQGQEYDEPCEEHEGSGESLNAGVVDESVERVGEEMDEAGDEGKTGEYPAHLATFH